MFELEAGYYRLGIKCNTENKEGEIWLGVLEINSIEDDETQLGQWYFKSNIEIEGENTTERKKILSLSILDIAHRLGLRSVIFEKNFRKILISKTPICLVADTNSLLHGHFEQAIRLRGCNPTHISIPDQVYMEVQLQREKNKKLNKTDDCIKQRRFRKFQFAVDRSIKRIDKKGVIIHYIRPPEAMVRYFGSDKNDSSNTENDETGTTFYRDRLILEALRRQREILPNIPVWLVTGDVNFAIQAKLEGFNIGVARQSNQNDHIFLTSPYIEPVTLTPHYLPVEDFLEECLWDWGCLILQKKDESKQKIYDINNITTCNRILLGLEDINCFVEEKSKNIARFNLNKPPLVLSTEYSLPVSNRAPTMTNMIKKLESIHDHSNEKVDSITYRYLQVLNWVDKQTKSITSKGRAFLKDWQQLKEEDIWEWHQFIQKLRKKVQQFDKQLELKHILSQNKKLADKKLMATMHLANTRDAQTQSMLANVVGLAVRWQGLTWYVEQKQPEEAAQIIYNQAKELITQRNISSAVRVDTIFTTLLEKTPLSLPDFRIGLYKLFEDGKIKFSGTVPDSVEKPVKIKMLVPNQYEHGVDLGAGDILIPNQSSQAIIILED